MCAAGTPRSRRGRARAPDHAAHHRRLRRRLRLRRPLQHLLLARDREGDAAGRLRRVLAGGVEGARARPRQCRRHHPVASAWRPFRRAAVPPARRAARGAARASADHRRAADLARADRGGAGGVLPARADQPVAFPVRDRGDRARPADRNPRTCGVDRPRSFTSRARRRRRCAFPTAKNCSPIPATPPGPTRSSASPMAPIFSLSNATVTPAC